MQAKSGDCCYFLTRNDKKTKFGTITRTFPSESAVEVMEVIDGKYHVVWESNAAWNESELKGQKWEMPHNYKRDIPEDSTHEKKSPKRISNVRNRQKTKSKHKRPKKNSRGVSKRASRK